MQGAGASPFASFFSGPFLRRGKARRLAFAFLAALALSVPLSSPAAAQDEPTDPPSILLIVTDDQRWDTLWAMPEVQGSLVERGVSFSQSFTTSSALLSEPGLDPDGGLPAHDGGVSPRWSPRRLQVVRRLDHDRHEAGRRRLPHGILREVPRLLPIRCALRVCAAGVGPMGRLRPRGVLRLRPHDRRRPCSGTASRPPTTRPTSWPIRPRTSSGRAKARCSRSSLRRRRTPPRSRRRSTREAFGDLQVWRPPSFNEADRTDKPGYVRVLPRVGPDRTEYVDTLRRNQYRSLQAVDRAVDRLMGAMEDTGRLDDALVIYTSDNGLLWGEHRWIKKEVPYEEAIRVPLIVRADAVVGEAVRTDDHVVANIDLAPTIADAAGVELPDADGNSLIPLLAGRPGEWRRAVLIEHLRGTNPVPTYCAVRTARYLFASYETGERELYDLDADPFQLAEPGRHHAGSRGTAGDHAPGSLRSTAARIRLPDGPGRNAPRDRSGIGAGRRGEGASGQVERAATGSMSRPMAQVTCPQCQTRQEIDADADGYRCIVVRGHLELRAVHGLQRRFHTRPGTRAWTCPNCGTPHGRNRRGISSAGFSLPILVGVDPGDRRRHRPRASARWRRPRHSDPVVHVALGDRRTRDEGLPRSRRRPAAPGGRSGASRRGADRRCRCSQRTGGDGPRRARGRRRRGDRVLPAGGAGRRRHAGGDEPAPGCSQRRGLVLIGPNGRLRVGLWVPALPSTRPPRVPVA